MSRELIAGPGIELEDAVATELTIKSGAELCQVSITHPDPEFEVAVIGTGDTDLQPPTGYTDVLNGYTEALNAGTAFTVQSDGRVLVNRDGILSIEGYADVAHSANNTTVGVVFSVERGGSVIYSPRAVHADMPAAGDIGNLSGTGALQALQGDIIGIAVASNITGDVSFRTSTLKFRYEG